LQWSLDSVNVWVVNCNGLQAFPAYPTQHSAILPPPPPPKLIPLISTRKTPSAQEPSTKTSILIYLV
jgi:hypothetical protein